MCDGRADNVHLYRRRGDRVRVGLINYPRFPSTPEAIFERAVALADLLRDRLCQHSYSVVATDGNRLG